MRYFFIPFIALFILFFGLTYMTIKKQINEHYTKFEKEAISIAEGYSFALLYSHDAQEIIMKQLEEKLTIAIQGVLLIEDKNDNLALSRIADRFQIDEIHLYNKEGEIIYSKGNKYVGWKVYKGHPIYDFMISNDELLVEDIRKDSESDNYYKYAYIKNHDGSFIQIGILADNISKFLTRFEFRDLVNHLFSRSDVINVLFINNDFVITASGLPQYEGEVIDTKEVREQISKGNVYTIRTEIENQSVFQVYVPIFHDEEIHGTLSVVWLTNTLDSEVRATLYEGIIQFIIVIVVVGVILYYAYRKDKANIRIAYYDKLTGLPNNEYLEAYLGNEIKNRSHPKAIFLLNCMNFKMLNMTYGFSYGDEILIQIANKVMAIIDSKDRLFRFGADRFVLVVEDYQGKDELRDLGKRIISQFKDPFSGSIEHQYVNVEISVVEIKKSHTTVDKILQDATLALGHIDKNLSEHICFYEDIMEGTVIRQDKIEKALRAIIKNDDRDSLYIHFQPKWDIKNKRIMGFEALARLHVEGLGNVSPIEFIDIAEKRLLIYDLGNQILERACEFIKRLNGLGFSGINISVNVSGIQLLRDEFLEDVTKIIDFSGIDKRSLEFEITESVLFENFDLINEKLNKIKNSGISISLDDFGTGFSSLGRLHQLNIDIVKIDRYFINQITQERGEDLIVADIISMSHKFGLTVVAEGVETEEQKKYLEYHDCDILQGYLISKPLNEGDAISFLSQI